MVYFYSLIGFVLLVFSVSHTKLFVCIFQGRIANFHSLSFIQLQISVLHFISFSIPLLFVFFLDFLRGNSNSIHVGINFAILGVMKGL